MTNPAHLSGHTHLDHFIVTSKSCSSTGIVQKHMPTSTQTATPHTTEPLAQIVVYVIGLPPSSIGFIMTFIFRVIWTEMSPRYCTLTTLSEKHISYTWRNLSAGQSVTIPSKTTCANSPRQLFLTGQIRSALITGSQHLKPFSKSLLV